MSPDSSQPRSPADAAPAPADTGAPVAAAAVPAETTPTPAETARGAPAEPAAAPAEPPPVAPAAPRPVDPPPVEPPPVAADAPPTAVAALAPVARSRLRRLVTVGGTLLILFILWETFTYFVAYTDDAYVRSDLVAVAPEVTGPIIALYIVDNQQIKKGDKLFTIDPVPFQLEVNQRQAQIEEQTALVKVAQEELATARAALEAATSSHTYAVEQQARYAVLAAENNAPRAELDRANNELRRATAEMTISQVAIAKALTSINVHQAALDVAKADKATAEWKLSRTDVVSPTDGTINNLTVRIGDTATVSIPNIGIVDANAWRIIANYKQYYIRSFEVGETAWVWLDSAPWKFHRARITGIARGISRDTQMPMLLPYVAPTTDWIRLQRRIPVTIVLVDPPPDARLYMGADARTVIFPKGGTFR
ncbi:MAG: rane fusion protein multidrug efflux system [Rhodospirillaceae bacterium]|jgi:multidrug efflux system membrane fusion protein|nr:rane fusion protein multidrug efflux system [Rhodospirillaceae bacterium]